MKKTTITLPIRHIGALVREEVDGDEAAVRFGVIFTDREEILPLSVADYTRLVDKLTKEPVVELHDYEIPDEDWGENPALDGNGHE
jgi:hypothetical protein